MLFYAFKNGYLRKLDLDICKSLRRRDRYDPAHLAEASSSYPLQCISGRNSGRCWRDGTHDWYRHPAQLRYVSASIGGHLAADRDGIAEYTTVVYPVLHVSVAACYLPRTAKRMGTLKNRLSIIGIMAVQRQPCHEDRRRPIR